MESAAMLDRQRLDVTQKALLDAITTLTKTYCELYKSPLYKHSKTVIVLQGQRYRITDFKTKWRKCNETDE